ncbi:MAG: ComF family protein [Patescibacteria group bacterium]
MLTFLIKLKNITLDILFPPFCVNCQQHLDNRDKLICDNCYASIKLNNTLFCPVCRTRLAENKQICHFASYLLASAGNYDDPVLQNLIRFFKFKSLENLSPILGKILIKYLNSLNPIRQLADYILNPKSFIIIPIPLHPQRKRERGFNQAELLAKFVSDNLNLEMIDGLKRIKNTEPQSKSKNRESRLKNISGCFKINPLAEINVKNKNIILVDDVFTSGATMNEAIKILKSNGAKKIIALVLAKT